MDRIRILLIGSAFSADLHLDAYSRHRDRVEIAAICTRAPAKAHALASKYGFTGFTLYDDYSEAIRKADCDLVDLCIPNYLHYDACIKALDAGRSVVCEKPLATRVEHGMEMVKKARKAGRYIYYAEDWMFAPALLRARAIIGEGAIGKVQYIRAKECHGGSHSPYAQTVGFCGGGSMIHLGIHPIGFILAFKGNEWAEVIAMASGGGDNNIRHKNLEGEDWASALIRFRDGTAAQVDANYITMGGMEDVIDFYGDKGCLHADLSFSSALSCFSLQGPSYTVEKAEITAGWSRPVIDEKYNLGYPGEIGHFLECARLNRPADTGLRGEDGLAALELVFSIYKSVKDGVKVVNPNN